ncbi:hypothetical protein JEZ13_05560 [bacterium]|nr:hypothetical protein [bacterium]
MHKFKEKIEEYKTKYNLIISGRLGIEIILLLITLFQVFNVAYNLVEGRKLELFYTGLTLRVTGALLLMYIIFVAKNRFLNSYQAARLLDKINNDINDTYLSSLELLDSPNSDTNPFIRKIIEGSNDKVDRTNLVYPSLLPAKTRLFYSFLLLGHILLFSIFAPNFKATWQAFYLNSMPQEEIDYSIDFIPGDTTLVSNQDLTIEVLNFNPDFKYQLSVKRDEKWRNIPLTSESYTFEKLDYSFEYYLSNEKSKTRICRISVYDRIAINQIKVIYEYPPYTRLETEEDTLLLGNISAIEGTKIKLIVDTNTNIKDAWMIYSDGNSLKGESVGSKMTLFSFQLKSTANYHLKVINTFSDEYSSPTKNISVIPDLKPEINLSDYPPNGKISKNQIIPLTIKLSDDYGLQNLRLFYEINSTITVDSLLFATINNKIYNHSMQLNLSKYKMYPGDEVTFWASVEDNLGKKHLVESERVTLRLPTLQEIFQEIEETEKQQNDLMSNTLKESEVLQEEFEKKRRELLKKDELEWKDKEEIKNMVSQQEELSQNVEKSIEKMQEMIQEATQNEALTQETLQKMERIKELMEEINSSEMQELMQKMKDKMSELSTDDFKKALEEMKFSMEDFNEKLEQTLKMLEQLKKNQSLEKLLGLTEEMKEMQEDLLEKSDDSNQGQELAKKQEEIKDKLQAIQDEMEKLKDMLNSPSDKPVKDEMNKMESEVGLEQMAQQMENISQQMQNNQSSDTKSSQEQMLDKMSQMSESMLNMQSMMNSIKSKEAEEAKDKLIKEILYYSQQHKELFTFMGSDPFLIFEKMITQHEMLDNSLRKFFSIPEVLLSLNPKFMLDLSNTMSGYNKFFIDVSDKKVYAAKGLMTEIQSGLNSMIFSLLLDDGNQQSGGSGGMQDFMQQMQEMGQQQMAMNMLAQQMMQQLGQGKPQISNEMRGQMRQMSADENRLAENIKRMIQTNPQAQKQASGLNRLVEELESVSNKLRFNKMDQELLKQQENILSRMLEATKSINKKDQSQKRKGQEADDKLWDTPEDLEMRFKELENNALLEEEYLNYSKEYQKIILEYLKRLNRD